MDQEWVSLNKYMEMNHLGYATVKRMMAEGTIEYKKFQRDYKIKVSKNAEINKYAEKLIRRNEELETSLKLAQKIIEDALKIKA